MAAFNKKEIIQTLEQIAVYLEIKGENAFRVSAYRKAAQALERDERTMAEIGDPSKLKGIGKGTASIITELMEEGKSSFLDELKEDIPSGLVALLSLPGMGGKKIGKLYQELGVENADTLRKACEEKKVQSLAGFGAKTEEKILKALDEFGKRPDRLPIAHVMPAAAEITRRLNEFTGIERFELAGSFRRGRETVKDLDFIISTSDPEEVGSQITMMENIETIVSNGVTKISVELSFGDRLVVPVDFRMVEDEAFASTLHHFTGSKDHNVLMRQRAKEKNEKISEYGVESTETGEVTTFKDETGFFAHFGLPYIPPEIREGYDELETEEEDLNLIKVSDIKADLHMHTTWSDGAQSVREMAEASRGMGYTHMAITDHSKFLRVANGLDEERLKRQQEEIRKVNDEFSDFTILTGIEMDILPDGSLDFSDDILKETDFVIASIHSAFKQDEKTIMKRLETAMNNPYVAMVAHPTGRLIGRRDGYPVDMERLIEMAAETGTILELNANPNRLDLASEYVKKAQEQGVKIGINTDAHKADMLAHMQTGVKAGRRGWLKKENVVNTWDVETLLSFLSKNR
ncbi:DNA polymerase/3'-5' exonuclease PolX [Alteribacter natronophilus]|uniref:DNA polymerase/3'-5' exonuclease PolX n=1 Tax=Alteribacter natronophilus TaxID=2583810 RepID=UPI00110DEFE7|nr:DNA polymerase/3'-5' exonuclease PolX [Alteribacter natronophilus]TMW71655.1 DNA polymerase/3'-5' exonuclease PolX [Alteribacter natronophilus]